MDWTIVQGRLCNRGACSDSASELSLAAEQSMNGGQESWIWAFYKWDSFEVEMFRVGKWAFPCC